jgi:hypothetical protein
MERVASKDGTTIAFDRSGDGPSLVLVGGALADRSAAAQLSAQLAPHLTVIAYDRRGRGDSGDTAPYAVEREVEDIEALIVAAGGQASYSDIPRAPSSRSSRLARFPIGSGSSRCTSRRSSSMPADRSCRRTT